MIGLARLGERTSDCCVDWPVTGLRLTPVGGGSVKPDLDRDCWESPSPKVGELCIVLRVLTPLLLPSPNFQLAPAPEVFCSFRATRFCVGGM